MIGDGRIDKLAAEIKDLHETMEILRDASDSLTETIANENQEAKP